MFPTAGSILNFLNLELSRKNSILKMFPALVSIEHFNVTELNHSLVRWLNQVTLEVEFLDSVNTISSKSSW